MEITDGEVIATDDPAGNGDAVTREVGSEDGEPVEDGQVMIEAGGDPAELGENEVGFVFGDSSDIAVSTATHENRGSLEIHVLPPEDADYTDDSENVEIEVIDA